MNPPAFQFYVDDFLGGTMNFTDSELGFYARLLCVQWSAGSLPDEDDELLSYSRGGTSLARVKKKFKKCADGRLRNTRMEIERKKQKAFRKSRALNGKKGGRPSKASGNLVVSDRLVKTKPTESSPSPVSSLQSPDVLLDREKAHDSSVELPMGFPKTEAEAKAVIGSVGVTESFAVETWNKAMGRHGRDAKDVPIRSWPHYLKSESNFQKNRDEKEKMNPSRGFGKPRLVADHDKGF